MASDGKPLQGVIRGKMIELDDETGLPEGASVSVVLKENKKGTGEGLRRAFGAWADAGPALDEFLERVRRDRHSSLRETEP